MSLIPGVNEEEGLHDHSDSPSSHIRNSVSIIEDIENLNKKATNPELDVTAVSVHACAYTLGYTVLTRR